MRAEVAGWSNELSAGLCALRRACKAEPDARTGPSQRLRLSCAVQGICAPPPKIRMRDRLTEFRWQRPEGPTETGDCRPEERSALGFAIHEDRSAKTRHTCWSKRCHEGRGPGQGRKRRAPFSASTHTHAPCACDRRMPTVLSYELKTNTREQRRLARRLRCKGEDKKHTITTKKERTSTGKPQGGYGPKRLIQARGDDVRWRIRAFRYTRGSARGCGGAFGAPLLQHRDRPWPGNSRLRRNGCLLMHILGPFHSCGWGPGGGGDRNDAAPYISHPNRRERPGFKISSSGTEWYRMKGGPKYVVGRRALCLSRAQDGEVQCGPSSCTCRRVPGSTKGTRCVSGERYWHPLESRSVRLRARRRAWRERQARGWG